MTYEFKFPDVGEGIAEGTLVKWLVQEGQAIKEDTPIAEVETDKAVVEIPSPKAGTITGLKAKQGDKIKVGQVLAIIEDGARAPSRTNPSVTKNNVTLSVQNKKDSVAVVGDIPTNAAELNLPKNKQTNSTTATISAEKVIATPFIRKYAKDKGIDITTIKGTGENGRITQQDVDMILNKPIAHQIIKPEVTTTSKPIIKRKYDMWGHIDRIAFKGLRKTTADHLSTAWKNAVLVTHVEEVDVTRLVEIRTREKEVALKAGVHLTYLPFIMKAMVKAINQHPLIASELNEENEEVIVKKYHNYGFAVDAGDYLVVPVIKGVDKKSLIDIAREISQLSKKARAKKLDLNDMKGGVISITNIGSLGGIAATPITNHPESSIISIMKIRQLPRYIDNAVRPRMIMNIGLTFDHRIYDGAEAARFVNTLKEYLEDPDELLL